MNKFTATIGRIIIAGTLFTTAAAQADETSSQITAPIVQVETGTELSAIKAQLVQDLQHELTSSIKQQASNALNHVAQTVKALLP